jgi:hypothetical protein
MRSDASFHHVGRRRRAVEPKRTAVHVLRRDRREPIGAWRLPDVPKRQPRRSRDRGPDRAHGFGVVVGHRELRVGVR